MDSLPAARAASHWGRRSALWLDPDRVSFTRVLRIARRTATGTAGFPPERWNDVLPDVLADITAKLVPLRRERTCPRAIKRARHNSYRVKRPGERSTRHTGPPSGEPYPGPRQDH